MFVYLALNLLPPEYNLESHWGCWSLSCKTKKKEKKKHTYLFVALKGCRSVVFSSLLFFPYCAKKVLLLLMHFFHCLWSECRHIFTGVLHCCDYKVAFSNTIPHISLQSNAFLFIYFFNWKFEMRWAKFLNHNCWTSFYVLSLFRKKTKKL